MFLLVVFAFIAMFVYVVCSTKSEVKKAKEQMEKTEQALIEKGITITNCFKLVEACCVKGLFVDEDDRKIIITDKDLQTELSFDDILECEVIENGSIQKSSGVGRAIVGGALAGGVGAIVGSNTGKTYDAVTSLIVKIITNDIKNPIIQIILINSEAKKSNPSYRRYRDYADQVHAVLTIIIKSNSDAQNLLKSAL